MWIKSIKSQGFHKEHDDLPIMGIGWGHIGYATGVSPTMDIPREYIGMNIIQRIQLVNYYDLKLPDNIPNISISTRQSSVKSAPPEG